MMTQETYPNITEKPTIGGFLAGIYLFSVPILSYSETLGLFMVPQYIGFILVIYAVYDLFKSKQFTRSRFALFYVLFAICSIISYLYSEHKEQTEPILTLVKVMIITVSISQLIRNRLDYSLCLFIFFISIFIALYLNYDEILRMRSSDSFSEEERFAGSFANANTAALYCLAVFWAGFTWLFHVRDKSILKIIIIPGLLLALMVTLYSGSRKGLLGLGLLSMGVAWVTLKLFGTNHFRRALIGLSILVAMAFLFKFLYHSPFFYRLQGMFEGESSSNVRSELFRQAIAIWSGSVRNLVVGIGINNFKFYNDYFAYSHSTISETLVSTGIIGFTLYFTGFLVSFSDYYKLYKKHYAPYQIVILFNLFMLFLILFFNSTAVMFDDRLFMPLLGIISAYGLVLKREMQNEEDSESDLNLSQFQQ
jgi:O-antigen ligase